MVQLLEAGRINLRPLISQVLPLERYAEGFEAAHSPDVMKILLSP